MEKKLRKLMLFYKTHALDSANIILEKIKTINHYNKTKYFKTQAYCTDIIENVDFMVMLELAKDFETSVGLPNKTYPYTHLKIAFHWGSIILIGNNKGN